jgi:colicin import membrane protein
MRENRADTALAIVFALLLHAVPVLLLLVASLWRTPPSAAAGEPISADVVDLNALSASMRSALRREPVPLAPAPLQEPLEEPLPEEPLPEALEEPLPEETPPEQQLQPQEQLSDPDTVDQQEVKPDSAAAETAAREQEARQRQAQVDLTERERQRQAEQKARTAMQEQRERQLADIRRQRTAAQRDAQLAEERLRQLADRRAQQASNTAAANASPPPGDRGADAALRAAYIDALTKAIRMNWTQPENISSTVACKIVIRQIAGGEVIDAQVDPSCPYDEQGRRSVEAAVLKAQPLPYRGFESVFNRTLTINFRGEDR